MNDRNLHGGPPLVELLRATVVRGGRRVFDRVSLTVPSDRSTVVLGPNGAGKSTLVRLILRDLYPVFAEDSAVRVLGRDRWNLDDLRPRLGFVSHELQGRHQRDLLGRDVVLSGFFWSVGLAPWQEATPEQRGRAAELAQRLGVEALLERSFRQLSAGEQRRLLLARALVHEPEFLLFDEPTNSLDLKAAIELIQTLRLQMQASRRVVLVTHRVDDIPPEIAHAILLRRGQVLAQGSREELLTDSTLSELYETPLRVLESDGYFRLIPRSG